MAVTESCCSRACIITGVADDEDVSNSRTGFWNGVQYRVNVATLDEEACSDEVASALCSQAAVCAARVVCQGVCEKRGGHKESGRANHLLLGHPMHETHTRQLGAMNAAVRGRAKRRGG